jgi:hypothetical protein
MEGIKNDGRTGVTPRQELGFHDKSHIVGMKSDSAAITLGLPPKITLKFKKQ